MNSTEPNHRFASVQRIELRNVTVKPVSRFAPAFPKLFLACFVICWATAQFCLFFSNGTLSWTYPALILLAALTVTAGLTRQLPGQNVSLAFAAILLGFVGFYAINTTTGITLGVRVPAENARHQLLWVLPVIWTTALLSCRGVARLLLRPIRGGPAYGYWMIGTTILLCALFEFSLEPFATSVIRAWSWEPATIPLDWYGMPWVNLFGWCVATLLVLGLVTPVLINKSPTPPPADHYSFWVWLLSKVLFLTAAAKHRLWLAMLFIAVELLVVLACIGQRRLRTGSGTAWQDA